MSYVVTATFKARPGKAEQFAEMIVVHAAASLGEQGCQVFDVCQNAEAPDLFLLYEAYQDHAAYLRHRDTAHYARFREWAPPLLLNNDGEIFQSRHVWQHLDPH